MAKVTAKLKEIVTATLAGSYVLAAAIEVAALKKEGLVEQNDQIKEGNKLATRATQAGIELVNAESGEDVAAVAGAAFALEDNVPVPKTQRGGRTGDKYPFAQMAVGQSFFVPATADNDNPAKSLASTVSSATARYAEPTGEFETVTVKDYKVDETGKRVKGEDGKYIVVGEHEESREVMRETRKFTVRAVEGGARVWRIA